VKPWRALAIVILAVALAPAHATEPRTVTVAVAGRIAGAARGHTVHVALWDAEGFLKTPRHEIQIAAGRELQFRFAVSPGRWTISAYEDRNENGALDMGLFGPKEPTGFWRAFNGWHKPRFDEVAVSIDADVLDVVVILK
jgi:uncharacterized protein (DUF2141 family)